MFKLWSDIKTGAKNELKPNLGLRSWSDLNDSEKIIMWQHLDLYFFDKDKKAQRNRYEDDWEYEFFGEYREIEAKKLRILKSIATLNQLYKAKNYAPNFLENMNLDTACSDFLNIFLNHKENTVLELLSLYCKVLLAERSKTEPYKDPAETKEKFEERTQKWRFEDFDQFAEKINEVFEDFCLNIYLTQYGFTPKQDSKITEQIYEPVLSYLSDTKWENVNKHLSTAFKKYLEKDYSGSITNSMTTVQAFLQILVTGRIGKGNISELISRAQSNSLIPNDTFSKQIFNNIEAIFARERQDKSEAHPTITVADEKIARTVLNLVMIFIQHCIQL